jgi:hypothetical protein
LYHQAAGDTTLYDRAVVAAGKRASALLRAYLVEGSGELRRPIVEDDRGLFLRSAREALLLAGMAAGTVVLSDEELQQMIDRP